MNLIDSCLEQMAAVDAFFVQLADECDRIPAAAAGNVDNETQAEEADA
jgi:hypothetical protein